LQAAPKVVISISPESFKQDDDTVQVPTRSPPHGVADGQEPPALDVWALPPLPDAPALAPPKPAAVELPPFAAPPELAMPLEPAFPPESPGPPPESDFEHPIPINASDSMIPNRVDRDDLGEMCME
jgi:hypothetical protein